MLNVTFYELPNGKQTVRTITKINEEDARFFQDNNLEVSMEELATGQFVIYSTTGKIIEDEEDEVLYLVPEGQSCPDAMHALVNLVKMEINGGAT